MPLVCFFACGIFSAAVPCAFSQETYITEIGSNELTVTLHHVSARRTQFQAQITLSAPPERVWEVLTDYEHLSEFIPNLKSSRILRRQAKHLFLYQQGKIWFPLYRRQIQVIFRIQEVPKQALFFEATEGDFVVHKGSWRLEAVDGGTRLTYEATIEPRFWIPQIIQHELDRALPKANFRAIVKRCERGEGKEATRRW